MNKIVIFQINLASPEGARSFYRHSIPLPLQLAILNNNKPYYQYTNYISLIIIKNISYDISKSYINIYAYAQTQQYILLREIYLITILCMYVRVYRYIWNKLTPYTYCTIVIYNKDDKRNIGIVRL